jgi:hypothetical protein
MRDYRTKGAPEVMDVGNKVESICMKMVMVCQHKIILLLRMHLISTLRLYKNYLKFRYKPMTIGTMAMTRLSTAPVVHVVHPLLLAPATIN